MVWSWSTKRLFLTLLWLLLAERTYGQSECNSGDVRLAGGGSSNQGRVEACIDQQWGTVCGMDSTEWTVQNTHVVCRQLGFSTQGSSRIVTLEGSIGVHEKQFSCSGEEPLLLNCNYSQSAACAHTYDVTIRCSTCQEGEIRLVGESMDGRLEVCLNQRWGTVCDDGWTHVNTEIVCGELGFSTVLENYNHSGGLYPGYGEIHMDLVQCAGSEDSLLDCSYLEINNCFHFEDISVHCEPLVCDDGDVRLVGSDGEVGGLEGRVELCQEEEWGTVCDSGWSADDATVVCRQLGFSPTGAEALSDAQFGEGSGDIFLVNVDCDGTQVSLVDCPADMNTGCTHANDAGVRCKPIPCTDGDYRLVEGLSMYEGRVEVCTNGEWETLCGSAWSQDQAEAFCKTDLGFSNTVNVQLLARDAFGRIDCQHINIRCGQCTEFEVRLEDGDNGREGRVEVCWSGDWGTVCDNQWDHDDAAVICSSLDFSRLGAQAVEGGVFPPNPSLPIALGGIDCDGDETSLRQCGYSESEHLRVCTHDFDAGVRCQLLLPPPTAERIRATQMKVDWSHFSLKENVTHYTVKYYPVYSGVFANRTAQSLTRYVQSSDHEVVIYDLYPVFRYAVSVAPHTVSGMGEYSDSTIVELAENSPFQLSFGGAFDCEEWLSYNKNQKLEDLSATIALNLEAECQCQFSTQYILINDSSCHSGNNNQLIVQGTIVGTNNSDSTAIRKLLEMWVGEKTQVTVVGVQLTALPCSISPEGDCASTSYLSDTSSENNSALVPAVIAIAILLVLAIALVLACAMLLWRNSSSKKRSLDIRMDGVEIDSKETHFNNGNEKGAYLTPEDTYEAIPGDTPGLPPPRSIEKKAVLPPDSINPYAATTLVYSEPTKKRSPPKEVIPSSYQKPVVNPITKPVDDGAYELDGMVCEENPCYSTSDTQVVSQSPSEKGTEGN